MIKKTGLSGAVNVIPKRKMSDEREQWINEEYIIGKTKSRCSICSPSITSL